MDGAPLLVVVELSLSFFVGNLWFLRRYKTKICDVVQSFVADRIKLKQHNRQKIDKNRQNCACYSSEAR
jgi:hypothetical protein